MRENLRTRVAGLIDSRPLTGEELAAELKITKKTLSSVFYQLRLTGRFPVTNPDGTYRLVDAAEFEAMEAARIAARPPRTVRILTPEEKAERLERMKKNAEVALRRAQRKVAALPEIPEGSEVDRKTSIKRALAKCSLGVAECRLELLRMSDGYDEAVAEDADMSAESATDASAE